MADQDFPQLLTPEGRAYLQELRKIPRIWVVNTQGVLDEAGNVVSDDLLIRLVTGLERFPRPEVWVPDIENTNTFCFGGECIGHVPSEERIEEGTRIVPDPHIPRTMMDWHCWRPMKVMVEVYRRRCRICGRQKDWIVKSAIVVCVKCGLQYWAPGMISSGNA